MILGARDGLFGRVTVIDSWGARHLFIGHQTQGAAYHQLSPTDVQGSARPGPGPVPATKVLIAWLMAGLLCPEGQGLMLGLGSGTGAVGLLHNFPGLRLVVLEIDPTIIAMATEFFPLVNYFVTRERLRIIETDAMSYLQACENPYDFVLFDLYQGQSTAPLEFSVPAFASLMSRAGRTVWVNILGSLDESHVHRVLAAFDAIGNPIRYLYSTESLQSWLPVRRNWIATTSHEHRCLLGSFVPFSGEEGNAVEKARQNYSFVVETEMRREQAAAYATVRRLSTAPYKLPNEQ